MVTGSANRLGSPDDRALGRVGGANYPRALHLWVRVSAYCQGGKLPWVANCCICVL